MMQDYEYFFVKALHTRLKPRIKGKIFVNVFNDVLNVEITTVDDLIFEWHKERFSEALLNNYSTEYAAYEVKKEFTKFIEEQIFTKYFWND